MTLPWPLGKKPLVSTSCRVAIIFKKNCRCIFILFICLAFLRLHGLRAFSVMYNVCRRTTVVSSLNTVPISRHYLLCVCGWEHLRSPLLATSKYATPYFPRFSQRRTIDLRDLLTFSLEVCALCSSPPFPPVQCLVTTIHCLLLWVWLFYIPHTSEIIRYLSVSVWLISLTLMPLRSVHGVIHNRIFFFFMANITLCAYVFMYIFFLYALTLVDTRLLPCLGYCK